MKMKTVKTVLATVVAATLIGCGGSNGSSTSSNAMKTGLFIDSAVSGLDYTTTSGQKGVTNKQGEYQYQQGDKVTFSLGKLKLPEVSASDIVTPMEVFNAQQDDNQVVNMVRLLMSIDADGYAGNGITLSAKAKENIPEELNFALNEEDFTAEVDRSFLEPVSMVTADKAKTHFKTSLASKENLSTYIGYTGLHIIEDEDSEWSDAYVIHSTGDYFMISEERYSDGVTVYSAGYEKGNLGLTKDKKLDLTITKDTSGVDSGFSNIQGNAVTFEPNDKGLLMSYGGRSLQSVKSIHDGTDIRGMWETEDKQIVMMFINDRYFFADVSTVSSKNSYGAEIGSYTHNGMTLDLTLAFDSSDSSLLADGTEVYTINSAELSHEAQKLTITYQEKSTEKTLTLYRQI